MDLTGKLKQGMRVVGPDQTEYGTVERYDDTGVYVGGRAIPYSAFDRLDRDRLYVGRGGAHYFQADRGARTVAREGEVRVPLVEERLAVDTRTVELGHLEVRKTVESEQVSVPVELRRDQVEVHQVDIEERPITILEGMDAFKEDSDPRARAGRGGGRQQGGRRHGRGRGRPRADRRAPHDQRDPPPGGRRRHRQRGRGTPGPSPGTSISCNRGCAKPAA